jgi:hypothetical protein
MYDQRQHEIAAMFIFFTKGPQNIWLLKIGKSSVINMICTRVFGDNANFILSYFVSPSQGKYLYMSLTWRKIVFSYYYIFFIA